MLKKSWTFYINRIFFYFYSNSLGPLETFPREMVSRRKILSRSRDDLNLDQTFQQQQEEEEDIWYQKDKLYKVSRDSRVLYSARLKIWFIFLSNLYFESKFNEWETFIVCLVCRYVDVVTIRNLKCRHYSNVFLSLLNLCLVQFKLYKWK